MKKREYWIDNIKLLACVLVALGHLLQSFVKSNIMQETELYNWFNTIIYYFHVPLFFICSGYLYLRNSEPFSIENHCKNIFKKFITLGIPFFVFSILTYILKNIFSNYVNNEIGSLLDILFINPYPPYWYLYTLFVLYCIVPSIKKINSVVLLLVFSFALKIMNISVSSSVFILFSIMTNMFWFVFGMFINFVYKEKMESKLRYIANILFIIFIILSVFLYTYNNGFIDFFMGFIMCVAILCVFASKFNYKIMMSSYTTPIFLMHTIFASSTRTILNLFNFSSTMVHLIFGLLSSFVFPILATKLLEYIRMDYIINPNKLINSKND